MFIVSLLVHILMKNYQLILVSSVALFCYYTFQGLYLISSAVHNLYVLEGKLCDEGQRVHGG